MNEWQPIETGPENEKVLVGWWREWPQRKWETEVSMACHGWHRNKQGISNMSLHGQATHWMPLPEPPK